MKRKLVRYALFTALGFVLMETVYRVFGQFEPVPPQNAQVVAPTAPPPAPTYSVPMPAPTPAGPNQLGGVTQPLAAGSASVTFAWNLSSAPLSSIRSQTFGFGQQNGTYTNLTTLPANTTTYQCTNLAYATTYYFAVLCTDTNNLSSQWSVPLQYTTTNTPPPNPPPAPTGLKVLSVP